MIKKLQEEICNFLLSFLLCFSIIHTMLSTFGLNIPVYAIIATIAAFLVALRLIFLSRLSMIISSAFLLAGLIYAAFRVFTKSGPAKVMESLLDYFYWFYDLVMYGTTVDPLFSNITLLVLCLFTSVYFYFLTWKSYSFLMSILPGIITFSVQAIYNYIATFVPFYIFIFTIVLCYFRHIHDKNLKTPGNEYLGTGSFMFWVIPVAVIAVLPVSLIKTKDKPLEWKWLDTKINAIYNYFYDKFDYVEFDYFSVAGSGFGEKNSLLGGRVRPNNTLVLTVEAEKNVYLKGTTYDKYTGKSWINTGEGTPLDNVNNYQGFAADLAELLLSTVALSDRDSFIERNFSQETVKITYQNIRTKSVFLPAKLISFTPADNTFRYLANEVNDTITSDKRLTAGFSYELEYIRPKHTEELVELLRKSRYGLNSNMRNIYQRSRRNYSGNYLGNYYRLVIDNSINIYQKYLDIPETVPQRVFDLASSLTDQYDNNYDKVKALEDYLSSNYPYNLNVRSLPRDRDFVDYFLFDQKEGYCTYYASALTIMARCIGIPARYVEGYILPPKPSNDNPKLYYVTNNQAHAWTEVYFEGYGWMPFEATSPFRSAFYSNPDAAPVYSGEMLTNPDYMDYMEMMREYYEGFDSFPIDDLGETVIEEPNHLLYAIIAVSFLILLVISILVFGTVRNKMKLYKIMNLEPRESVLKLYKYFVTVLGYTGFGIQAGETPLQYSERVDGYYYLRPVKFKDITDIFIRSRYSNESISEKEKQILVESVPRLISEVKNDMGKLKFFLYRRVLGRF